MTFFEEFKAFAFKGNVVDLAVGVVIGGAFSKIVSALVADIIMPLVALALPAGSWRGEGLVLRHAADPKDEIILRWGDFLGSAIDLLVISMTLFLVVGKLMKWARPAAAATK